MRTETIVRELYQFDELTDSAKAEAVDWYARVGLDYEWWEQVDEDARNVGIKITEFDIDRGSMIKGSFLASAEETAHSITRGEYEHGPDCETFKTASAYLAKRDEAIDTAPKDEDGEFTDAWELDQVLDTLDAEFLHDILEDYLSILRSEFEYLTSRESIEENIRANEYEFTADGQRA